MPITLVRTKTRDKNFWTHGVYIKSINIIHNYHLIIVFKGSFDSWLELCKYTSNARY